MGVDISGEPFYKRAEFDTNKEEYVELLKFYHKQFNALRLKEIPWRIQGSEAYYIRLFKHHKV